jgi:hypothetical protein
MTWLTDWGDRTTEQRCRELEQQLNSRPDTGKLWLNMQKIGRIVNNKAPKSGSLF